MIPSNIAQFVGAGGRFRSDAPQERIRLYIVPHRPLSYPEKRERLLAYLGKDDHTRAELLTVPGLTANDVDRLIYALLHHGLIRKYGSRRCKVYALA